MDAIAPDVDEPGRMPRGGRFRGLPRAIWMSLVNGATVLWRFFVRHLFAIPAACFAFVLLFMLPQSKNLLWQPPSMSSMTTWEVFISIGLTLYLPALILFYGLLSWALMPQRLLAPDDAPGLGGRLIRFRRRIERWIDAPLLWLIESRRSIVLRWHRVLLGLAAVLLLSTWYFDEDLPTWWRVSGSTYATWIALTGIWFYYCSAASDLGFIIRLTGRGLVLLLLTGILGKTIWFLPEQFPSLFSYRIGS